MDSITDEVEVIYNKCVKFDQDLSRKLIRNLMLKYKDYNKQDLETIVYGKWELEAGCKLGTLMLASMDAKKLLDAKKLDIKDFPYRYDIDHTHLNYRDIFDLCNETNEIWFRKSSNGGTHVVSKEEIEGIEVYIDESFNSILFFNNKNDKWADKYWKNSIDNKFGIFEYTDIAVVFNKPFQTYMPLEELYDRVAVDGDIWDHEDRIDYIVCSALMLDEFGTYKFGGSGGCSGSCSSSHPLITLYCYDKEEAKKSIELYKEDLAKWVA